MRLIDPSIRKEAMKFYLIKHSLHVSQIPEHCRRFHVLEADFQAAGANPECGTDLLVTDLN